MDSTHDSHLPSDSSARAALNRAFYDNSLPIPARLDAARHILQLLAEATAAVRETAADLVRSEVLDEDLVATLYWQYDDLVPLKLLGKFHDLREMLEERCPWTYPCPSCGADQRLTSRTALKQLQKLIETKDAFGLDYHYTCLRCREARMTSRAAEDAARQEVYRRRLRELKTMPYREYLKTPEWQERRKARLKAARYSCQVCNTRNVTLNVHHRTYVRRGEEYAQDLIVLCEGCHHLFHRNGSLAPHEGGA